MALDYAALKALAPQQRRIGWAASQTILYALGLGATELDFVYEAQLHALPTLPGIWAVSSAGWANPAYGIDPRKLLHAEQAVELQGPVPVSGEITATGGIEAIIEKGAHAFVIVASRIADAQGQHFATTRSTIMVRGAGGFAGDAAPPPPPPLPERARDLVVDLPSAENQAMLYRLSGDLNPIHIDPALAQAAGFPQPLLHGMCSYGMAGRALIAGLCGNNPAGLAAISCRFAAPVYPGEAIRMEIWREGSRDVRFRALAAERGAEVLAHGFARLA